METEYFPGIVIDPVRCLPELFLRDPLKVRPFWVAAAEHTVLFFIGAPLAGAIRVTVVDRRPLFPGVETGPLEALAIRKLGAVVYGD